MQPEAVLRQMVDDDPEVEAKQSPDETEIPGIEISPLLQAKDRTGSYDEKGWENLIPPPAMKGE